MAYLLHIETTSTVCSVAVSHNDKLLAIKEINNGYSHAENLHLFITEVLNVSKLKLTDIHAISISNGPGSYTGLRIGYSTAKGLCYALNIPLISISTLQALSSLALSNHKIDPESVLCPLIDAQRMEVYLAVYDHNLKEIIAPEALIINEPRFNQIINSYTTVYFFGDGMTKTNDYVLSIKALNFKIIQSIEPSANALINLAFLKYSNKEFDDIAYAEPFYLKEFYFTSKKTSN